MSPLDRRCKDFHPIRDALGLAGLPTLGHGAFGIAIDAGDHVVKVTFCKAQSDFCKLSAASPMRAFPKIYTAHGQVGVIGGKPVYAARVERLKFLYGCKVGKARVERLLLAHSLALFNATRRPETEALGEPDYQALALDELAQHDAAKWCSSELTMIATLMRREQYKADLTTENLMRRDNGDIVFSDPVKDAGLF